MLDISSRQHNEPKASPRTRSEGGRQITDIRRFLGALTLASLCLPGMVGAQLGLAGHYWWQGQSMAARTGAALATGDFNGDGALDLAIGSPEAHIGAWPMAGRISITGPAGDHGSSFDLVDECAGAAGAGYRMGAALAFGDFDADGDDDLAIGMPGAVVDGVVAGAVCVISGGGSSVSTAPQVLFSQGNLPGVPESGDFFGAVLATGDLNGDGYDDLAVSAPGESVGTGEDEVENAGAVHVIFGGVGGLSGVGSELLHQGLFDPETPAADEYYGASLAIGNFLESETPGLQGIDDLAIGAPGDSPVGIAEGSVTVFLGRPAELFIRYIYYVNSPNFDLFGTAEDGDEFGASLTGGDFNGDGETDLAIGIPGDSDFGPEAEAGAVMVLYMEGDRPGDDGEQVLVEANFGGTVNGFDRFGEVLTAGDLDGDGLSDLVVGSPLDNSLGVINAGEVRVLYGSASGLQSTGSQVLDMIFFDTLEPGDEFGAALATGRLFDRHEGADLFIGVPGRVYEDGMDSWPDSGGVVAVQSTNIFSDGFESGDTTAWSSP